jgi:hypothetical protein
VSPPVTGATAAPPVNRTYIKVLIGWNTSTKSASDEFGFTIPKTITHETVKSRLKKTTVRQLKKLSTTFKGPGTKQHFTYLSLFSTTTMTDISPDTEDITDKANTLTVEVGQDQRSDWGTTVDTSAQW